MLNSQMSFKKLLSYKRNKTKWKKKRSPCLIFWNPYHNKLLKIIISVIIKTFRIKRSKSLIKIMIATIYRMTSKNLPYLKTPINKRLNLIKILNSKFKMTWKKKIQWIMRMLYSLVTLRTKIYQNKLRTKVINKRRYKSNYKSQL